jgi:hypothetical protein
MPLLAGTAELDGTKIEYTAAGKGRTAIVLIHGWTCDRTLWDAQVEALKGRYRVLAVDLPGHGASGAAPDYSMRRFARAVEAVMRAEKIERAVLAGHSSFGRSAVVEEIGAVERIALLGREAGVADDAAQFLFGASRPCCGRRRPR